MVFDEGARLAALASYQVMDTEPEAAFDRLTALAADLFDAPMAMVSLVDSERQWFKARHGVAACSTPREWAFCAHTLTLGADALMVVEDARKDSRFAENPLVTGEPHVIFYAGATLTTADGHNLGTLCIIDSKPRARPTPRELQRLQSLAKMVVDELELNRSRREVVEQKRLLDMAEDVTRVGYWRVNFATGEMIWSRQAYAIHGIPYGPTPDVHEVMATVHPDDLGDVRARLDAARTRGQGWTSAITRLVRPDGEVRYIEGWGVCDRNAQGEVESVFGAVLDVTERRDAEQELIRARADAEAAAKVKAEFLANMSHEIRTPLTAIIGFSQLLKQRGALDEIDARFVQRVLGAGEALLSIVNDILDFSKLEAGRVTIDVRPVNPLELACETLGLFDPQAEAKGLKLECSALGDLPERVLIDRDHVRQVLLNLIGNAVKFTETGSVRVGVGYDFAAERLRLQIEDTGPGMTKLQQQKLFQRFSQIDASNTRQHGGTGLGLAICKGLVDAMGGAIGVVSAAGRGTTFSFSLGAQPAAAAPGAAAGSDPTAPLAEIRVLVVDDNRINRDLARLLLENFGAEVSEAGDGREALELANELPVDVILLDLRMPDLPGEEVLARLRKSSGPNRDVPVLAFTAETDLHRLGDQHGFDGMVRKPIVPADLAQAITQCLDWIEPPTETSLAV